MPWGRSLCRHLPGPLWSRLGRAPRLLSAGAHSLGQAGVSLDLGVWLGARQAVVWARRAPPCTWGVLAEIPTRRGWGAPQNSSRPKAECSSPQQEPGQTGVSPHGDLTGEGPGL